MCENGLVFVLLVVIESAFAAALPLSPLNDAGNPDTNKELARVGLQDIITDSTNGSHTGGNVYSRLNAPCPFMCQCYADVNVHCSRANLSEIPCDRTSTRGPSRENVFPLSITNLYLDLNQIRQIPQNCLVASGGQLKTLSIRNNSISVIDHAAFAGLSNLENLDLRNNHINALIVEVDSSNQSESVFLELMDGLLSLQLSYNEITAVPRKVFRGFHNLQVLSLSYNRIEFIAENAFEDLTSLRILYLGSNPLNPATVSLISNILSWFTSSGYPDYVNETVSESQISQCLPEIAPAEIALRRKREIPVQAAGRALARILRFKRRKRNVDHNERLETLDLRNLRLTRVPRDMPASLLILFLGSNNISLISNGSFTKLINLNTLHLASNGLYCLADGVFSNLYNLKLLDLSSNRITRLTANTFSGLTRLSSLRLYNNPELTALPDKIFLPIKGLKSLYLQDCGLEGLPEGPWLHRSLAIWLYGNPIHCDCKNVASLLINIKYKPNVYRNFVIDAYRKVRYNDRDTWQDQRPEDTICHTPPRFQGYPVKEVLLKNLNCSINYWIRAIINQRLSSYSIFQQFQQTIQESQGGNDESDTDISNPSNHTREIAEEYDYEIPEGIFKPTEDVISDNESGYNYGGIYDNISPEKNISSQLELDYPDLLPDVYEGYRTPNGDYTFLSPDLEASDILRNETTQNTQWLIEIPEPVNVESVYEMSSQGDIDPSNIAPMASAGENITSPQSNDTASVNPAEVGGDIVAPASGNSTSNEAQLEESDNDFWESYEDDYDDTYETEYGANAHTNAPSSYSYLELPTGEFKSFESDYSNWLGEGQLADFRNSLENVDIYDEFDSYYYGGQSNDESLADMDNVLAFLTNGTDDINNNNL